MTSTFKLYGIIALVVVAILAYAGIGWAGYDWGKKSATAEWSRKYDDLVAATRATGEAEAKRQQAVIDDYETRLNQALADLRSQEEDRAQQQKALRLEARNDPHAGDVSLGAGSLCRLEAATPRPGGRIPACQAPAAGGEAALRGPR